jgi:MoxR-like ATPase
MSKAARKQLTEMFADADGDELEFEPTVEALMNQQNVQTVTAESYVWDYCETETNSRGEKVIVKMKETPGETDGRGDDLDNLSKIVSLDEPAGLPAGDKFEDFLDVLDNPDHPLVPDSLHGYYKRELEGGVSDIRTVAFDMSDPEFYTMLKGHTGTGKNALVSHVCASTNRPAVRINFGLETNKEKVVGMWVPEQDDTGWTWQDGLLTWCARYGGTFIADEFNGAGGEATMPLHGLLEEEGKRFLSIEERGEVLRDLPVKDYEIDDAMDEHGLGVEDKALAAHYARVEKWDNEEHVGKYIHPEFSFVATINPSSYAGTQNMNDATRNRFYEEWIPYMEWDAEKRLLSSRTPLNDDEAESIVKTANRIRARLAGPRSAVPEDTKRKLNMMNDEGGDIYSPIGTRDLIKAGRKTKLMNANQAAKSIFKSAANPEDVNAIEGIIDKIF